MGTRNIMETVSLASVARSVVGYGRCGTAVSTLDQFASKFGGPHERDIDDKVTMAWYVDTPRGPACIRDYWWNVSNEMSIGGPYKACLWAAAWLRAHGIRATARKWYELKSELAG